MSLADQIIEHGPYRDGDSLPIEVQVADAAEVNALRDELIEGRRLRAAAESRSRFEVSAFTIYPGTADLQLRHRCTARTWAVHIQHPLALAELVRRAAAHAEECR